MIAKVMKGSGFKGVINYILDPKKGTELIDSSGVRTDSINHIVQSFIDQTELNPRVGKVVGHISLSFSVQDSSKLSNKFMAQMAREYMEKMGIKDTQYIIGRHLLAHLKKQDIDVCFKYKGNSQEVQGIIFEKNGYHFNGSKVDRSFSYSKIDFALQQNNREHEQQTQGMINLISNVTSVTSEITNDLIEGGLGLFQTHGTVPAEVYNTLDKKKKKKKRKIHL